MNFKTLSVVAICLFCFSVSSQAQPSVSDATQELVSIENASNNPEAFFMDYDEKVYFIDFERFNVNINRISLVDKVGKELFSQEVWDLPVNTIYELDLKKYKFGQYTIKVETFKGLVYQEFELR